MRKLIEITFLSLDGVMDAPDIVQQAEKYFSGGEEQEYQKSRLFAADSLLLGRKTYENFSKAYSEMARSGKGPPMDFVERMNSIPKYVASNTLKEASWNATVIRGDVADEVRKIKSQAGKDIIKYGTGSLDHVLLDNKLVDMLCLILYPFVLGHGTHLLEGLESAMHLRLANEKRFESGTVVLEYLPSN
ncbi:MAG: dihydrofolate reductase family protein [Gemmatimonadaceae bacterium]